MSLTSEPTTKPEEMPPDIWRSLMVYISYQSDKYLSASLVRVWQTSGVKRYWRAKLKVNDVTVTVYYSVAKGRWSRT